MVKIENLHFSYRRRPVFNGLSLELSAGHIYGLLGRNGTGKSTLLLSLAGFLFPKKGAIEVLGYQPRQQKPSFLEKVFLVPEEIQLPSVGVEEWLANTAPFYSAFDRMAFDRYYREFEIPNASSLNEMSYGQQKKLFISFALATNASLLLMDEPTNGLDIVSKNQLKKILAGAIDEHKSFVISTHQVKDLEQLIDRIVVIDEGRILFDQALDRISEKLIFKYSEDGHETRLAIYSESSFHGSSLILPNYLQQESRPDLELLYKAIYHDEKNINVHFND